MAPHDDNVVPWPGEMPTLDHGWHPLGPGSRGCLMEIVSLLAGEAWSDTPGCTHPALAEVARLANDASSPQGRTALLPRAGQLVGLSGRDARVAPTVVLLGVTHAQHTGKRTAHLLAADRWWASRRLARLRGGGRPARWCQATDWAYWQGPASRSLASAVTIIARATEPDERLRSLLTDCLRSSRELLGASYTPVRASEEASDAQHAVGAVTGPSVP